MKLTHFYAAPVCTPTRAQILTGCQAKRLSLSRVLGRGSKIGLNPAEKTIATLLKSRGYAAMAVGKWRLGDQPEFLPTLAGLAGGKPPEDRIIDGKDIWPLLSGRTQESPHEAIPFFHNGALNGLRSGKWKLLTHPQPIDSKREKHASHKIPALFDLEADPAESTNLADAHPDIAARLQKLVDAVDRDLGAKNASGPGVRPCGQSKPSTAPRGKSSPRYDLPEFSRTLVWRRFCGAVMDAGKPREKRVRSRNLLRIPPAGKQVDASIPSNPL
jgi:arylsulfatase A-like enzyme